MKKVILIIAVLMTSLVVAAQSTDKNTPSKSKTEYSFAWGLFKSKDYPKEKTTVFDFAKPEFSTQLSPNDSTLYVEKSMLWGAIRWTERKYSPVTPQTNQK